MVSKNAMISGTPAVAEYGALVHEMLEKMEFTAGELVKGMTRSIQNKAQITNGWQSIAAEITARPGARKTFSIGVYGPSAQQAHILEYGLPGSPPRSVLRTGMVAAAQEAEEILDALLDFGGGV
jgi:hypothetical protein